MLAASLFDEAKINRVKARLAEARERYNRCLSTSMRASRGEKLRAQGALQVALRELMQAELNLEKLSQ